MNAKLELALLGRPQVRLLGYPVTGFRTRKAQALLYFLAVTGQAHARSSLAGLLWGDMSETSARTNLSKALSELRALVPEHVMIERGEVSFNQKSNYWLDIGELEEANKILFDAGQDHTAEVALLEQARGKVGLYRGDFLHGFTVRDAPDFELWMVAERHQQHERIGQILHRLIEMCLAQGRWHTGIEYARRRLGIEPWHENTHCQLMLLFAYSGERAAALTQYEACRQILMAELDVEPDAATTDLYARIRAGELGAQPSAARHKRAGDEEKPGQPTLAPASSVPQNLPRYPTPFIGRAQELLDVLRRLEDADCRLLSLVGPGGSGKTRLALATAERLLDTPVAQERFADGIFFVPLQPVATARDMISAIAAATNFQFFGDAAPNQQLLAFLRHKRMLLVFDNFEHLLAHTEVVIDVLASAPEVKILLTSRAALKLRQEWFHPVAGMHFSDGASSRPEAASENAASQNEVSSSDAVRLFVQCALRARPHFSLADEQAHVLQICRLVNGMPLGIELAAAWLAILPCEQIAHEIQVNLDILGARHQDLPPRHRSMRALLEQSWQMLAEAEQKVLLRLALFRGGFSHDAGVQVSGTEPPIMANLVEKSMLQVTQNGRFQMHELLRQFAEEKLVENPATAAQTLRQHAYYYLHFVYERTQNLLSRDQRATLREIDQEIDNIRAAWQGAVAQGMVDALDRAIEGLFHYCEMRGRFQEGNEIFGFARSHLDTRALKGDAALLSRLAARQAALCLKQSRFAEIEALLPPSILETLSTHEQALVHYIWGVTANKLYKDRVRAKERLRQSLRIFQEVGDLPGQVMVLRQIATVYQHFGGTREAEPLVAEALAISRRLDLPTMIADALVHFGFINNVLGHYTKSQRCWEEAHALYHELGHEFGLALTHNWLGWAQWCAGGSQLDVAVRHYEQAVAKYQRAGAQGELAMVLGDLALAYVERGDADYAMHHALEGLRGCEATGDIHMTIYVLSTVGAAACAQADYATARTYLRRALALALEHHVAKNSAPALYFFANVLMAESEGTPDRSQQDEQRRQAQQIYHAIINDRASWQVMKDRARAKCEQVRIALPPLDISERASATKSIEQWARYLLTDARLAG